MRITVGCALAPLGFDGAGFNAEPQRRICHMIVTISATPLSLLRMSESGIRTAEDLARIKACGVDAVLIGEALMRGQGGFLQRDGGS